MTTSVTQCWTCLGTAYSQVALAEADGLHWRTALVSTVVDTIETLPAYPGLGAVALGAVVTLPGALAAAEHELMPMEIGGVSEERAALTVDLIAQLAAATASERSVRRRRGGRRLLSPAHRKRPPRLRHRRHHRRPHGQH
ncbi:hypothetical protein [Pseudokineococcus sp. 1T1Z-3]|uniref:hypothetical protein n=1 Tax=Pseudokineococcus sp. 1T1Z-3 TaxID=3132745 RepID=UPI0030ADAA58